MADRHSQAPPGVAEPDCGDWDLGSILGQRPAAQLRQHPPHHPNLPTRQPPAPSPRPSPHGPGRSARAVPGSRGRARLQPHAGTSRAADCLNIHHRLLLLQVQLGSAAIAGPPCFGKKKKSFSFSSVINSYNLALNNWLPWELLQHRLRFPLPAFLSDKDLHLHMLRFKLQPGYFMQIFLVCSINSSSGAPASTATDA